jgi:hypothetical protein
VVPVLAIGEYVQKGFEQSDYDAALDAAGYKKAPAAAKSSPQQRSAVKR